MAGWEIGTSSGRTDHPSVLGAASGRLYHRGMSSFDYSAPAELFLFNPRRVATRYRRFATAAEALRYAVEDLRTPKAFGAHLEVGDERFDSSEIQRLYEAEDYPLRRPVSDGARARRRGLPCGCAAPLRTPELPLDFPPA